MTFKRRPSDVAMHDVMPVAVSSYLHAMHELIGRPDLTDDASLPALVHRTLATVAAVEHNTEPVLEGVRVVELSMFALGSACAAVLGDWGADVIKVVHPTMADPMRGQPVAGLPPRDDDLSFMWEQLNRNKRSITLDVANPSGRTALEQLLATADVFVTNLLPDSRARLRVDVDDICGAHPRIVYARGSGQGTEGPEAHRGAFDHTAFWCRSGIGHAASLTADEFQVLIAPAMGDLTTGLALAGGVAGALLRRERTGRGGVVDTSLLATGMWMLSSAIVASKLYDIDSLPRQRHRDAGLPLIAAYRTADGREVYLAGIRTDTDFRNLCECLGRPEIGDDDRFATPASRSVNNVALVAALDAAFAARPLAHWVERFADLRTAWTVAQTALEVHDDPQVVVNGYLRQVQAQGRTPLSLVASPVQFDGEPPTLSGAPEHGAHTEQVLLELGLTWDEIGELRSTGALG